MTSQPLRAPDTGPPYRLIMTKYGPAHGVKQASGRYVACPRRAALCKYCAEDGVPIMPPDPINALIERIRDNWDKRWFELDRHPPVLADNVIDEGQGVHVIARSDDRRDATVLFSLGTDPAMMIVASAICHVHNEMIGRPD